MTIEEELNKITSWGQGYFVDQPQYRGWTEEAKQDAQRDEALNVRPSPTGNALCRVRRPDHAAWIAKRLNKLARIEAVVKKYQEVEMPYAQVTKMLDEEF